MTVQEAVVQRHSVRSYKPVPIEAEKLEALRREIDSCNAAGGLHIQLVTDEEKAFDGFLARYGKFSGVRNYIALIGRKSSRLDESAGYYGERLALFAQTLGLNTCWVGATFSRGAAKSRCAIDAGEKLVCVLALGYGEVRGEAHASRPVNDLCVIKEKLPLWFENGMKAVLFAPTAMNQQRFLFSMDGTTVKAISTGGFYSKVDFGIVK
ncbi:MAG: hypothetical protein K2H09_03485, partial [Treponemataceae bacterium]|nr:hypothetical protein [Treponemataceae bacterium]